MERGADDAVIRERSDRRHTDQVQIQCAAALNDQAADALRDVEYQRAAREDGNVREYAGGAQGEVPREPKVRRTRRDSHC